jgi:hypothetical protein
VYPLSKKENEHDSKLLSSPLLSSPLLSSPRFSSATFTVDNGKLASFQLVYDGKPQVYLRPRTSCNPLVKVLPAFATSEILKEFNPQQKVGGEYKTITNLRTLAMKVSEEMELITGFEGNDLPLVENFKNFLLSINSLLQNTVASKTKVKNRGYKQITYFDKTDDGESILDKLRRMLASKQHLSPSSVRSFYKIRTA